MNAEEKKIKVQQIISIIKKISEYYGRNLDFENLDINMKGKTIYFKGRSDKKLLADLQKKLRYALGNQRDTNKIINCIFDEVLKKNE